MDAFDRFAILFGSADCHRNMNAADNQHPVLGFNLATDIGGQAAFACIDLARLQRAPEGSHHSAARSSYDVIQGGCMRARQLAFIHSVVLCDRAVNAELDRAFLTGKLSNSPWTPPPLDVNVGNVSDISHLSSKARVVFYPEFRFDNRFTLKYCLTRDAKSYEIKVRVPMANSGSPHGGVSFSTGELRRISAPSWYPASTACREAR
jgi:hypothetical protein